MTFTYVDPANSTLEAIRLEIGDTEEKSALLSDEEINYCISKERTIAGAAARACEAIAKKFAREAAEAVGADGTSFVSRSQEWRAEARRFRRRASALHAPTAGGLSKAEKETAAEDDDRLGTAITLGMHDNPGG